MEHDTARKHPHRIALAVTTFIFSLLGAGLLVGGVQLALLGGSWYYMLAGLALLGVAVLVWGRRRAALLLHAAVLVATLLWSLWEAGLAWWPLATRVGLLFLLGAWLLTPWVRGALVAGSAAPAAGHRRPALFRGAGLVLTLATTAVLAVSVASWWSDPTRIEGRAPDSRNGAAGEPGMPAGEWHVYGRTAYGQRYSPLAQITPRNVDELEVAWTYRTGDVPGQPGDPVETTFEVTPLKIGNRLFLCTPHQFVIALDATTGEEIWRLDPNIQDELALQHLTCRGLSYHPGPASGAAARGAGATDDAPAASSPATRPVASADSADEAGGSREIESVVPIGAADPDPVDTRRPAASSNPTDAPIAALSLPTAEHCTARLFMPTADGRLLAIDPGSGRVCPEFGNGRGQINLWQHMPNINPGSYYSTSPVVVTEDLIIVGGTVLDNVSTTEASGVIRAFDVQTGELAWAWDPGDPDDTTLPVPSETYTASSPNSWSISSVDEDLGLVYVPLGNQPPDQWGGDRSEAVERFSSSIVALDLATGRVRWVFQTVHHDLWDYDVPSQPSLVDLDIDGRSVPALVQPTKQGEIYVLDRRTGQPLLPVTEVAAPQDAVESDRTAPTQPVSALSFEPPPLTGADMWGATLLDQLACRIQLRKLRYEGRYTPPSLEGSLVYPGNFGVFNWGSIAVDPVRQIAFTTPTYLAFTSKLIPRDDEKKTYVSSVPPHSPLPSLNENFGAPFAVEMGPFLSPLGIPCQQPPWGYVAAADLTTGEIIWRHRNGTVRDITPLPLPFKMGVPNIGGPIMTAGGVAFLSGTIDNFVRGYDVTTGRQLWEARLPAGGQATPMTYLGADGRQYLLVVAGGHGSLGTDTGDYVIAYALEGDDTGDGE